MLPTSGRIHAAELASTQWALASQSHDDPANNHFVSCPVHFCPQYVSVMFVLLVAYIIVCALIFQKSDDAYSVMRTGWGKLSLEDKQDWEKEVRRAKYALMTVLMLLLETDICVRLRQLSHACVVFCGHHAAGVVNFCTQQPGQAKDMRQRAMHRRVPD